MHWSQGRLLALGASFGLVLAAVGGSRASADPTTRIPPKAAVVTGAIEHIELGPILRSRYVCMEHSFGELEFAGDALGTDCLAVGGAPAEPYIKFYRTDGRANEDWYGWGSEVLAPASGDVVHVSQSDQENVPGTFGRPGGGGGLRIRTSDGIVISIGHLTGVSAKVGDKVKRGEVIGKVGNSGMSRAPHTHLGAYREATAAPLQIRWDLRSMAEERAKAGEARCPGCKEAADRFGIPTSK